MRPQLPIWDHLEELRERVLIAGLAALVAVLGCFCYSKVRMRVRVLCCAVLCRAVLCFAAVCACVGFFHAAASSSFRQPSLAARSHITPPTHTHKETHPRPQRTPTPRTHRQELVLFLEAPVADAGVRFLQLSPGEFFFTTFKVAGYSGLLLAAPTGGGGGGCGGGGWGFRWGFGGWSLGVDALLSGAWGWGDSIGCLEALTCLACVWRRRLLGSEELPPPTQTAPTQTLDTPFHEPPQCCMRSSRTWCPA